MAATVINSQRAVAMSVYVVRVCENAPRAVSRCGSRSASRTDRENTLTHDTALRDVYQKRKPLLLPPPETPKRRIGFHTEEITISFNGAYHSF
jgi:hypothetical protein